MSVTAKPVLKKSEKIAEAETHGFPCQAAVIIEYS